jgi:hypothetical protein
MIISWSSFGGGFDFGLLCLAHFGLLASLLELTVVKSLEIADRKGNLVLFQPFLDPRLPFSHVIPVCFGPLFSIELGVSSGVGSLRVIQPHGKLILLDLLSSAAFDVCGFFL